MSKTGLDIVFESELTKVREVTGQIIAYLKSQFPYIMEDDLYEVRIIFSEILVNAVIHGNNGDSSKKVEIRVEVYDDQIKSTITDEGTGFDYREKLDPDGNPENLLSETGRGLKIISSLTESLDFGEFGNIIKFRKRIPKYDTSA